MNAYQPSAASAVEVCAAAALVKRKEAGKVAGYVVGRTTVLVNGMVGVPLSEEILQSLEIFEQKLDAMRRYIEQIPAGSGKKAKILGGYKFKRETSRLKKELESQMNAVLAHSGKPSKSPGIPRSDCILELASLSTRAAGAICEAPVLNFLKPAVGISELICDTAKSVKSNRDAATELAKHASAVTKCIVERVSPKDGTNDGEALKALKLTLDDVQSYLAVLRKPRRRVTSWLLANQEKDRFVRLNGALDKALATFSSTTILSTAEGVRANTHTLSTLVSTVGNVNHALTVMHGELERRPIHGSAADNIKITAFVPFCSSFTAHVFFLDPRSTFTLINAEG
ncbi:hypothetical protein C8R44DRAFT_768964 [Mycena epipterygia]|nr:hypothetical protein C8R44DRAFT_768964 [Mycena epipterygia]